MSWQDLEGFFTQLFSTINHKDSWLILLFLLTSFFIGWLFTQIVLGWKIRRLKKSVRQKDNNLVALQANYESQGEQLSSATLQLNQALEQNDTYKKNLQELEAEKGHLRGDLYTANDQIESLQETAGSFDRQLMEMRQHHQQKVEDLEKQVDQLQVQLSECREQIESYQNQVLAWEDQELTKDDDEEEEINIGVADLSTGNTPRSINGSDQYTDRLASIEAKLAQLEKKNRQMQQTLQQFNTDEEIEIDTVLPGDDEPDFFVDESDLARQQIKSMMGNGIPLASEKDKDDLKKIRGIGPFIEEQLNDIEIYTFEQISQLDDGVIELITDAIRFFPGRIKRDDWVGQARKLK